MDRIAETKATATRQQAPTKAADTGTEVYPFDVPAETFTVAEQQADALILIAETALHHGIDPGAPAERYQVVVHVEAAVLADAAAPDGQIVEVGARTRTIPPALRRALRHRDRGLPGSGMRAAVRSGHHIRHWAHGGPTTLSNLALLCRRHHRAVHEEGYEVEREPDGELRFTRPDGERLDVGYAIDVLHPRANPRAAGPNSA